MRSGLRSSPHLKMTPEDRGRIEFVRALPKTPTGNILKKDLRARAERIK